MQFVTYTGELLTAPVDLLVIGVEAGAVNKAPGFGALDGALSGALKESVKDESFAGKPGQRLLLHTHGKAGAKRIALVGLGESNKRKSSDWVSFGGHATRTAKAVGAKHVLVVAPEEGRAPALIARGAALGMYEYSQYKSEKSRSKLAKVSLYVADGQAERAIGKQLKAAQTVSESVALVRDLVNQSPLDLYPESFAKEAQKLGKELGLRVTVLDEAALKRKKMNLILGVGAGSSRGPRLVHLVYKPAGKSAGRPIVLVGKGVTFDSGGLSLKPPAGMVDMKSDMAGAATVLGTMRAVAKLKPKVEVHGILGLAENMPSGTAIRPGDVIIGAAGKSVEINNTDAEGRLVLADALHYAVGLKPKHVVDLATLTGACVVALGNTTAGLFSDDDALATALLGSANQAGEDVWRMPLTEALRDQLNSDVADLKNTGERWGGAITAGLFLREFVGDTSWAHLDIAGPATSAQEGGAISKGGTGVVTATLIDWLTG